MAQDKASPPSVSPTRSTGREQDESFDDELLNFSDFAPDSERVRQAVGGAASSTQARSLPASAEQHTAPSIERDGPQNVGVGSELVGFSEFPAPGELEARPPNQVEERSPTNPGRSLAATRIEPVVPVSAVAAVRAKAANDAVPMSALSDEEWARMQLQELVGNDNARATSPLRSVLVSALAAVVVLAPAAYLLSPSPTSEGAAGAEQQATAGTAALVHSAPGGAATADGKRQTVQPSAQAAMAVVLADAGAGQADDGETNGEPKKKRSLALHSACRAVDTPRRLARRVSLDVPVEVAVYDDRYYLGYSMGARVAGIVWSPEWKSISTLRRERAEGVVAYAPTPASRDADFVAERANAHSGPTASVNHEPLLALWMTSTGLNLRYGSQRAVLWDVERPSLMARPVLATIGRNEWAVATRDADERTVRLGQFELQEDPGQHGNNSEATPSLDAVPRWVTTRPVGVRFGGLPVVDMSLAAAEGRVVLAAMLSVGLRSESTDRKAKEPQSVNNGKVVLYTPDPLLTRIPAFSVDGVVADGGVQVRALAGRRWLLQWVEGQPGATQVHLLTLDWQLNPLEPPTAVSPIGAAAVGVALQGDRHPASFYLVDTKASDGLVELWAQPLSCR